MSRFPRTAALLLLAALAVLAALTAASSSSAGSNSGDAGEFYTLIETACPPNTVSQISPQELYDGRTNVCCDCYTEEDPSASTVYCGDDLLTAISSMTNVTKMNCVSSIRSYPFNCCAEVTAAGEVSNKGRACPAPTSDATALRALAFSFTATVAVVCMVAAAVM